jgi:hypothetical protein
MTITKLCPKCNKNIPSWIKIDGKKRNLKNRKYCFDCSPFNQHNTRQLHCQVTRIRGPGQHYYQSLNDEEKQEYNRKIYNKQKIKRWALKKEFVEIKGGKCKCCEYNKNLAALSFHHRDPNKKSFELDARTMCAKKREELLEELDKCDLLCMNCHQELHHPNAGNW